MKIREAWTASGAHALLNEMEQGYQQYGVLCVNPFEVLEAARWTLDELAATIQRTEAAEKRAAELEAHLAARQRRAELDAAGIGEVCPQCGYELDADGWCAMCEVQP